MSLSEARFLGRERHPFHAFLLAGTAFYLVSGLVSDWLYFSSHEIQWKNFATWLIMGGLVFGGVALLWAALDVTRARRDRGRQVIYALLLLVAWVLSLVNELVHAKDAWASMPEALVLSLIVAVVVIAAAWLGFADLGSPEPRRVERRP